MEQWLDDATRRLFINDILQRDTALHMNLDTRELFWWIYKEPSRHQNYFLTWIDNAVRLTNFKMLSIKKKSKPRKRSLGFSRGGSGSISDLDNRVVMLCEDIPSETSSSGDSGRGSQSSGTRSSGDELGHGLKSQSFHGRETRTMSSSMRPVRQYSVREVRQVESPPVYVQNASGSTLCIRELYEFTPTATAAHAGFTLVLQWGLMLYVIHFSISRFSLCSGKRWQISEIMWYFQSCFLLSENMNFCLFWYLSAVVGCQLKKCQLWLC